MVNVAILGFGVVGSGAAEVLADNRSVIEKKLGTTVAVKRILDLRDFPDSPFGHLVTHDFNEILTDPDISVVAEMMGGSHPAYDFTKACLEAGKSVVTSNKEVVARFGAELLEIAAAIGVRYLFEASVGGGIPILRPLVNDLASNAICEVSGILNGTTNYILTRMRVGGVSFEAALKEAQEKGYAERNPEADVEGHDACRKISILSSLMMGKTVDSQKVYTEGITKITAADFAYAKAMGRSIKLLGRSQNLDSEALVMVAPFMISAENPLYMVSGVFNAISVKGNMLGESMYYGRGAGKLPTASAVVADVVECARNMGKTLPCLWEAGEAVLADVGEVERSFYLRVDAAALGAVQEAFPGGEVIRIAERSQDAAYVTAPVKEKECAEKCAALGSAVANCIRMGE